ncbi:DMT family transporter [Humibacter ginsenosidimutans]|uniref:DMT family transporter n=1 Tax=Humibacter ginsenosidimutans TaxID=2599293 RepID=UPI001FEDCA1F|nr:DMT family transporter [Humibacter ginsenosidimutans]
MDESGAEGTRLQRVEHEFEGDARDVETAFAHPSPARSPRLLVSVVAVVAAALGGGLITIQARINGQLALELGDGYTAALISFFVGLVVIAVVSAVSAKARRGIRMIPAAVRSGELPWWMLLGGFAGATLVLSQGLAVTLIGVALFTVAIVAGQTIGSLVIDARGMGKVPPKPVTATRVIGTIVVIGSVALSVSPQINAHAPFLVLLMPLIAGCLTGWQQAVNGQVRTTVGSPVTATLVNFIAGTLLLGVVAIVHIALAGPPASLPTNPALYLGGVLGMIFIMVAAVIVPLVGVLLQGLAAVTGQLVAALVIEALFPAPGTTLQLVTIAGTLLTIVGLAISVIPKRAKDAARTDTAKPVAPID